MSVSYHGVSFFYHLGQSQQDPETACPRFRASYALADNHYRDSQPAAVRRFSLILRFAVA